MNDTQIKTLEQVRQFLEGTGVVDLTIDVKEDRYVWIQHALMRFRYWQLGKSDKGRLSASCRAYVVANCDHKADAAIYFFKVRKGMEPAEGFEPPTA